MKVLQTLWILLAIMVLILAIVSLSRTGDTKFKDARTGFFLNDDCTHGRLESRVVKGTHVITIPAHQEYFWICRQNGMFQRRDKVGMSKVDHTFEMVIPFWYLPESGVK